jgi:hypothetical protein
MKRRAAIVADSKIILYFQEMDNMSDAKPAVKPVRKARLVAEHHIKGMFAKNRVVIKQKETGDYKHLYKHMIPKIADLLNKCEETCGSENKIAIVTELFDMLVKEPFILVRNPRLRNAATMKLEEFEGCIAEWKSNNEKHNIRIDIRNILAKSLTICHKGIRNKIIHLCEDIMQQENEYYTFLQLKKLKGSMQHLRNTIQMTKNHPLYVA